MDAERCSCGNSFDGDNLCMPSACQWEGLERPTSFEDRIDARARELEEEYSETADLRRKLNATVSRDRELRNSLRRLVDEYFTEAHKTGNPTLMSIAEDLNLLVAGKPLHPRRDRRPMQESMYDEWGNDRNAVHTQEIREQRGRAAGAAAREAQMFSRIMDSWTLE